MKKINLRGLWFNYILMTGQVFVCAFEYILAKPILEYVPTLTLLWMKYIFSLIALFLIKYTFDRKWPFTIRDIPFFLLLAVFGEVLYYSGSYNAIKYIPVALVTVVIALCPVMSIVFERFLYKKKVRLLAVLGIAVSIFGISMVVGVDTEMLAGGRFIGYLLAFVCVICANLYNVVAIKLTDRYNALDISIYMIVGTLILCTPFALSDMPSAQIVDAAFIWTLVFLGVAVGGFGAFAYINALGSIGATTTLMFSNFVPVVACFFGWVVLGETILPLQLLGGAITLTGCATVIWYNGKAQKIDKS